MPERRKRRRPGGACAVLALVCWAVLLLSCSSARFITRSSGAPGAAVSGSDRFFLERMQVTAFGFTEARDIGYILDGKLRLAFLQMERARFVSTREEADYLIVPELIVKQYRSYYRERFYCQLLVRVAGREQAAGRGMPSAAEPFGVLWGSYEYSGGLSIFEVKVQNALLEKLVGDFENRLFGEIEPPAGKGRR